MKKRNLFTAMALGMSLVLSSCSDDDKTAQQTVDKGAPRTVSQQSKSNIMSYIPADTPILAVYAQDSAHPLPENFKAKVGQIYSSIGELLKASIQDAYKTYEQTAEGEAKQQETKEIFDKWLSEEGLTKLGLSVEENEFALYTVDLFPVFRMTLAKTHSMGEVLDELLNTANTSKAGSAAKKDMHGSAVYQFGDKEMQVWVSLNGNEISASLAPTREAEKLMPKLLGFEKPAKNILQSDSYNDTIAKYNYMSNGLYWIDVRQIADYFINPDSYNSPMLDLMKVQDKQMSADCKSEILGMFDKFPRLVGGSTRLDDHNVDSHLIWEMSGDLGSKLKTLIGRIPASQGEPSFAYGISFDISAAKNLALEFVTEIEQNPYKCELLQGMNTKAAGMKAQLNQPLPPFVSNFRGVNIILDNMDLDFSQTDPDKMIKNLKAKVLLAVDNPEAIKGMAQMMLPQLQEVGLDIGGGAVNVSKMMPVQGSQMPINMDYIFMAMGKQTIGASIGEGTDVVLAQDVALDGSADLFNFSVSAAFYKNLFAGMDSMADKLPEDAKKQLALQKAIMGDLVWWERETGSINFTDRGLEISAHVTY